jgi:hypothetical protein
MGNVSDVARVFVYLWDARFVTVEMLHINDAQIPAIDRAARSLLRSTILL